MKQDNTTQPLYKVLDSERGQGEWKHIERDEPETSRIPFGIIIPFHGACAPIFDTAAFPPNDAANLKRMKADAQYTTLAVNNLSHLAEALETIKNVLIDWNGEGKYQNLIEHAKTALNKIS